jgi:S-adenosylmethionine hydrolase
MASGIITLTTDFGLEDGYVGMMKGAILSENRHATIVDLTHGIGPQHILQASFTIASAYQFFPAGTVHLIVVDPGVGTDRSVVVLEADGHIFLAPDNGVLSLVMSTAMPVACRTVQNQRLFRKDISRTFHGRDIFAPVAAIIASGMDLSTLGPSLRPEELVRIDIPVPLISPTAITGMVVSVDRFGNLVTNISASNLADFVRGTAIRVADLRVAAGQHRISGVKKRYADVPIDTPLALVGSNYYLEVAVNQGNAGRWLQLSEGDSVVVTAS